MARGQSNLGGERADAAVRLTVRTRPDGGLAEYELQHSTSSPVASPRRPNQRPSQAKPALKRRVHFAAEPDIQLFAREPREWDGEGRNAGQPVPTGAAAGFASSPPASPGSQSPTQAQTNHANQPNFAADHAMPYNYLSEQTDSMGKQWAGLQAAPPPPPPLPDRDTRESSGGCGCWQAAQPQTVPMQSWPQQDSYLQAQLHHHHQLQQQQQQQQAGREEAAVVANPQLFSGASGQAATADAAGDLSRGPSHDGASSHQAVTGHQHMQLHTDILTLTLSSPRVHLAVGKGAAGPEQQQLLAPDAQRGVQQAQQQQHMAGPMEAAVAYNTPATRMASAATLQADEPADACSDAPRFSSKPSTGASQETRCQPHAELPAEVPAVQQPQSNLRVRTLMANSNQPPEAGSHTRWQQQQQIDASALSGSTIFTGLGVSTALDCGCLAAGWTASDEVGATGGSSSSGLSSCAGAARRHEWDHLKALKVLAASADCYGHAARQQRTGRASGVSVADALPARLAAQQLSSLAGMSRKVQEAILHSQRLFERQALVVEQAVMARAYYAWRHLHRSQEQWRGAVLAARHRIELGQQRRCLHAWRGQCGRHEWQQQALRRARLLLLRGLLRRCWEEWRQQCRLRWWKVQLELRDQQVQQLGAQLRHLEHRPVRYMARCRLRAWLAAWLQTVQHLQAKQAMWIAGVRHSARTTLLSSFAGWQAVAEEKLAGKQALQRAQRLLQRRQLHSTMVAWQALVGSQSAKQQLVAAVQHHLRQHSVHRALGSWRYICWFKQVARAAHHRANLATLAASFSAWRNQAALAAATAVLLEQQAQARAVRLMARMFDGWLAYLQGTHSRRQAEDLLRLREEQLQLSSEVEHMRRENERLCRVIDSGDWGRQRVQELVQAGQVLQGERDALARLVAGLQPQHQLGPSNSGELSQLHDASNRHSAGHQQFRIPAAGMQPICRSREKVLGQLDSDRPGCDQHGHVGLTPAASRPCSPAAARNKLLVRNASSFNAMVRALKQDLITSGALQRSQHGALYEVDQLSLNQLSVTMADAGGRADIQVQAVGSPDRHRVAFGCSFPSSPKWLAANGAAGEQASMGRRADPAGHSGSSLLSAALKLQAIGGRSVGPQK